MGYRVPRRWALLTERLTEKGGRDRWIYEGIEGGVFGWVWGVVMCVGVGGGKKGRGIATSVTGCAGAAVEE